MDKNKNDEGKEKAAKFNEVVDAVATCLKAVSSPVVKLVDKIKTLRPEKKEADLVSADDDQAEKPS